MSQVHVDASHETEDSSSSVLPPTRTGARSPSPSANSVNSSSSDDSSSVSNSEYPEQQIVPEQSQVRMPPVWMVMSLVVAMAATLELPSFPTTAMFVAAVSTIVHFSDKIRSTSTANGRMLVFAVLYLACAVIWFTVKWQLRINTVNISIDDKLSYFLTFLRRNSLQSLLWPGSLIVTFVRGFIIPAICDAGASIASWYTRMMQ